LYQAINFFLNDPDANPTNRNLRTFTPEETAALNDIRYLLEWFHVTQEILSGEKTPTLCFVIPLYLELVGTLKELCVEKPNLAHAIHASILKIEKYLDEAEDCHLNILAMGVYR
jgi:hypothetical protein